MVRELGRYELIRRIAQGGMAEVYLARRRVAGVEKRLVIKRIRPERSADPRFLELFVREARLSMRLVHQNIVPVFDFGRAGDDVFLAMEHVDGRDLGTALARAGRLDPVVAAFVAAECCQALDYAHGRRTDEGTPMAVVHRDVTPRNIIIGPVGGAPTLIDWGIARDLTAPDRYQDMRQDEVPTSSMETAQRFATLCAGTPPYVSLEQASGHPAEPWFDVYTVGATLYEVIAGRTPLPPAIEAFWKALRDGARPPTPLRNDPELSGIILRAMARDPAQRFSAEELLTALRQYLTGELVFSHRYSPAGRVVRWAKRRPWAVASVLATVAVLLGVLTVWAFRQRERAEQHAVVAWSLADRKADEADDALRTATLAREAAEAAERAGQTDAELRRIAAAAAQREGSLRKEADAARDVARASSADAVRRMNDALRDREAAAAAADAAARQRDEAGAASEAAAKERDQARAASETVAKERDQARAAVEAALKERDDARAAAEAAAKERDQARAACPPPTPTPAPPPTTPPAAAPPPAVPAPAEPTPMERP